MTPEEKKARAREAARKYRETNRERLNAEARARRAADPERIREIANRSMKKAYAEDPEKFKERSRKWRAKAYQEQKHLFVLWGANRRSREAIPAWADKDIIQEIYDLARKRTQLTGIVWEVDHIVPVQSRLVCGLHVEHNLRVVPKALNRAKGNSVWPDHPDPLKSTSISNPPF